MDTTTILLWMGLGFFWVHTLLMSAHAIGEGHALSQRLGVWRRAGGLRRAQVTHGTGDGRRLAVHRIEQTGRSKKDGTIHFHDRVYRSSVDGGTLTLEGGLVITLEPAEKLEVWTNPVTQRAAAEDMDPKEFEDALSAARKARGFSRVIEQPVQAGDEVWLHGLDDAGAVRGKATATGGGYVGVHVPSSWTPVIATFDPRGWMWRRTWVARLVALAVVVSAAVVTVPMFAWEPFGVEAKLGALGAVVVFNLQQLWLKLVREYTRDPSRCHVRGCWRYEAPLGA